ncbi:amidohydrolase family protein [Nocardioides agariphilus]|jgi:predicted TIM-barrel fold metal-dependent hydrolase|uniref:Amidohydrolase family protein n=1 Tax=Nocardioides agariphilus TaxID=433664 RepID=A0A930VL47_9ACTN|nr:amidohydrolase family protein [Nocardioides agariphilus]MBF4766730.1 amidohydrolase family protein [Nocardioides agariphilus]
MASQLVNDAHRHIGLLPAFPFYGGPPVNPDISARGTVKDFLADLDAEGTERALVMPNYGVPDASVSFSFNELALEAAAADDRVSCGLWVSPRPQDAELNVGALAHAGEKGVKVLKTSFLLGGQVDDPACAPQLDQIFDAARAHGLVVHIHTSSGGASDIDQIGLLVDRYADDVKIHLVHLGGGVSAHIKLIGSRLFDWIEAGKQVYTDTSWAVGFAPRWLAQEIERRGIGQDRLLFASDEPWGDHAGELARLRAATGDGELGRMVLRDNFTTLYG